MKKWRFPNRNSDPGYTYFQIAVQILAARIPWLMKLKWHICYLVHSMWYFAAASFFSIFGLVLWHINHCRLFNVKSSINVYQIFVIRNIFKRIWAHFLYTVKWFEALLCNSYNLTCHLFAHIQIDIHTCFVSE